MHGMVGVFCMRPMSPKRTAVRFGDKHPASQLHTDQRLWNYTMPPLSEHINMPNARLSEPQMKCGGMNC